MTFRTLPFLRRTACVGAALALTVAAPSAFAADLVVSAAASLTNAFKTLAEQYEHAHPDTKVVLNFGASDVLMQQIVKGAPADVFASADQTAMDKAEAEKVVQSASRKDFAANQVVLIVPQDSKLGIGSLKDLTRADGSPLAALVSLPTAENRIEVDGLIGRTVEEVERELILGTLERCHGNRTSASNILGISVRTMRNKLRTFIEGGIAVPPAA